MKKYCHVECGEIYENIQSIISRGYMLNKKGINDVSSLFSNDKLNKCELLKNIIDDEKFIIIIKKSERYILQSLSISNNYDIATKFFRKHNPKLVNVIKSDLLYYSHRNLQHYISYYYFLDDEKVFTDIEKYNVLLSCQKHIKPYHKNYLIEKQKYFESLDVGDVCRIINDTKISSKQYYLIDALEYIFKKRTIISTKNMEKIFEELNNKIYHQRISSINEIYTCNKCIEILLQNSNFKINKNIINIFVEKNISFSEYVIKNIIKFDRNPIKTIFESNLQITKKNIGLTNIARNQINFIKTPIILQILENNNYVMNNDEKYYYYLNEYFLNIIIGFNKKEIYDKQLKMKFKQNININVLLDIIKSINGNKNIFSIVKNIIGCIIDMKYDINKDEYKIILMEYCKLTNKNEHIGKLFDYVFNNKDQ